MYKKKSTLTLLEVVIAMALAAIILGVLFTAFRHMVKGTDRSTQLKEAVSKRQILHMRLNQLFSSLDAEDEKQSPFHTLSIHESLHPALLLSYHQIDPDSRYSGLVKGMLYLNRTGQLCQVTWPDRQEVLWSHVKEFSLTFFDPQEKTWVGTWDQEKKAAPSMIKLTLKEEGSDPLEFFFFLPGDSSAILYHRKS